MASFNIVLSSGKAYSLIWEERQYFLKLALVPLFVKFVCYITILTTGTETDFLRQALIMLPSYFTEGWMLAHIVRLILLNQRWPFKPSGNVSKDTDIIFDRARGIMSATIVYVLIKLFLAGVMHVLFSLRETITQNPENTDHQALISLVVLASFMAFIWAFRLIWVYIPLAVNFPATSYIKKLGGYITSFQFIGVWLVCFIPGLVAASVLTSFVFLAGGEEASSFSKFIVAGVQVVFDIFISIVCTAGITYGLKHFFSEKS